MKEVSCNICQSNLQLNYATKGQHRLGCHVVLCKDCGFVYLSPRWSENRYLDFYANEYNRYYRKEKAPVNTYESIYSRLKSQQIDLEQKYSILDIGSGDGTQVNFFKNMNPSADISVIEPSMEYVDKIKSLGHAYISNDVNSDWEKNAENRFDLVIMRHVLEHILEPDMVLRKIRHVLKSDGILYIAVPNAMKIESDLFDDFFRVVHTHYYSVVSLTNVLAKNGYEILHIEEGDQSNKEEIFVIAKIGEIQDPVVSSTNFDLRYRYFEEIRQAQTGLKYRFRQRFQHFLIAYLNPLVRMKKKLFPGKTL